MLAVSLSLISFALGKIVCGRRVLQVELQRVQDFGIHRAAIIASRFLDSQVQLIGQANVSVCHGHIIVPLRGVSNA